MEKSFILIMVVILVVIVGIPLVLFSFSRAMTQEGFQKDITVMLKKSIRGKDNISGIQMLISSGSRGIDMSFAVGMKGDNKLTVDDPFHSASIGKTFIATTIYLLAEQGELSLQDKIAGYFNEGFLDGLFVYEGVDYQEDVIIEHLVTHTSGVADCFEGEVNQGQSIKKLILSLPDKKWTQQYLVEFSRSNQQATGRPGEKFLYSDTGYTLLCMIIEDVTKKRFYEVLNQELFEPLNMDDSYSMFNSKPKNQPKKSIATLWFDGVDVTDYNSVSAGQSDGGIVTTLYDLQIFIRALFNEKIISGESLDKMRSYDQMFTRGINYGHGMMQLQFGEFFFLLKNMPTMEGHIGSIGTYMMYNPEKDICIIANYGSSDYVEKSIRDLIIVMRSLERIK